MRLLVFFDLPVLTKEQKKRASQFRNFLLQDGYMMMQFSVYVRLCRGQDMVDKHLRRLDLVLPPEGSVRALQVTENQYARLKILVGKPKKIESQRMEQLVLL